MPPVQDTEGRERYEREKRRFEKLKNHTEMKKWSGIPQSPRRGANKETWHTLRARSRWLKEEAQSLFTRNEELLLSMAQLNQQDHNQ